ncbi:hypothetical protein CZP2022_189 [Vibrio phage C-ZP2022]|nr:hypothetical protein CZP2022_189 [Vibrio phage C-ZP2022]
MQISKVYEGILSSLDTYMEQDTRQLYTHVHKGKKSTVKVNYRAPGTEAAKQFPIVLVDEAMANKCDDPSVLKFNPMVESYLAKGQSEVQKRLVFDASNAVMVRMVEVFVSMVYLITNTEAHEGLTGELYELVKGIPSPKDGKAAEKYISYMNTVMKKHTGVKGRNALCRYQQQANVKIGDKTHIRVTALITPYLDKLNADQPAGIKPPNKDVGKMIRLVAERLKGYLDVVSTWDGRNAPYFMSLLECHAEVVRRLNKLGKLLDLDMGVNFNADWFSDDLETKLQDLYVKELNVEFPANQGEMKEQAAAPVVNEAPVQTTQTTAPVSTAPVAAVPQPTQPKSNPAETPKTFGPIKLEGRNNMAIQTRTEVLAQTHAPVSEYQSGFAKSSAATNTEQTVAVAQPAAAAPSQSTSAPVLKEAPSAAPTSSHAPVLKEAMVHVQDANGTYLYNRDNSPYKLAQSDIPRDPFLQEKQSNGALIFNSDGTPSLYKATLASGAHTNPYHAAPAATPANPYNAAPVQAGPYNPYHASNQQNGPVGFGHTAAAYGTAPQMPTIILMMRNGQQVQAQFDVNGNAMGEYFTSTGQPVTHFSQIAHLVGGATAPASGYCQPSGYGQPQQTGGFQFGQQTAASSYSHF